jgi:hypothetical protein
MVSKDTIYNYILIFYFQQQACIDFIARIQSAYNKKKSGKAALLHIASQDARFFLASAIPARTQIH